MFATLHEHRRNTTNESFSIKFKSAVGLAIVALVAVGALGFLFDYRPSDALQLLIALAAGLAGFFSERLFGVRAAPHE